PNSLPYPQPNLLISEAGALRCPRRWKAPLGLVRSRARGEKTSPIALITLRNAQGRRISCVRGVRPGRGRYEWPPHDAAPDRPPSLRARGSRLIHSLIAQNTKGVPGVARPARRRHLILDSRNSTCFLATGSYFFFTSL